MDIPAKFQSSSTYIATVAHKMNHSFSCNCEFSDMDHPVYGYIPCTVTTKQVLSQKMNIMEMTLQKDRNK